MRSPRRYLPAIVALALAFTASCTLVRKRVEPVLPAPAAWVPVGQVVTPSGIQVELPGLRPQVLALSPDGRRLVTSGKTGEIVVVDPATGALLERVAFPGGAREGVAGAPSENVLSPDQEGQVSYTGLAFSADGRRLYLSDVEGRIEVFGGMPDGTLKGLFAFPLPPSADSAPREGYSGRDRRLARRATIVRRPEPLQPAGRIRGLQRPPPPAASTSASPRTTSSWPGTKPMSATGAGAGPAPATRSAPPAGAPRSGSIRSRASPTTVRSA